MPKSTVTESPASDCHGPMSRDRNYEELVTEGHFGSDLIMMCEVGRPEWVQTGGATVGPPGASTRPTRRR
eukprot:2434698-Rhodomonas_salina.2